MPVVEYQGQSFHLDEDENLLDGLLKHGISTPFSCRAGVCHSCLLQVTDGIPPSESQIFLTQKQISKGFVLACQSKVTNNLVVRMPQRDEVPGIITNLTHISPTKIRMTISSRFPLSFVKGDEIYLVNHEGSEGCFPIETISEDSLTIDIVIARQAGGDPFSSWVHADAQTGLRLMMIKPF